MKRLAVLLCLALCLPLTARADDAAKRAKVQELLELQHIDRSMDQVMSLMQQQTSAATNARLSNLHITAEQKARVDAFQKQLFEFIQSQMSWKVMQDDYIDLYAQTFTEDEIDGMLAFYKSPAGAAMIAKTPELISKSGLLAAKRLLAVRPEIQKMIDDFTSTMGQHSTPPIQSN